MKVFSCFWRSVGELLSSRFVPVLRPELHKGQMGRIAVIGGSPDYTGAPYYSGEAALRFGADLSSIYCALEASGPIKSYSPEVMVTPFYTYGSGLGRQNASFHLDPILSALPRMHSYTIGPGLGRDPEVWSQVFGVLEVLVKAGKQVTIDADGLWNLASSSKRAHLDAVRGAHGVVLTPNKNEFDILTRAIATRVLDGELGGWELDTVGLAQYLSVDSGNDGEVETATSIREQVAALLMGTIGGRSGDILEQLALRVCLTSRLLGGVTILLKGNFDIISAAGGISGEAGAIDCAFAVGIDGEGDGRGKSVPVSRKRCGGQGDILSGCAAVATYWGSLLAGEDGRQGGGRGVDAVYSQFVAALSTAKPTMGVDLHTPQVFSHIAGLDAETEREHLVPPQTQLTARQKGNLMGCVLASVVVKTASGMAFAKFHRGMTAMNVLDEVASAFHLLTSPEIEAKA